jgi:hypothetical protein
MIDAASGLTIGVNLQRDLPMASPSDRKGAYYKSKNPHQHGNVACALFATFTGESNARALGNDKWSRPKAPLAQHAEQQWWADAGNEEALRKAALDTNLGQFEFEVSTDFCSKDCRDLFKKARSLATDATIFVFIMRGELCYEVDATGTVNLLGTWS